MSARQNRLFLVGALVAAGLAVGVVASGNIGENLVYFWDPGQLVAAGDDAVGATVRLGGVVEDGSVEWDADTSHLRFQLTDGSAVVDVDVTGAPPQMFREGIGVVVEGTMTPEGVFVSDRLMVKHSNEYVAPEEDADVKELYRTVEAL